MIARLGQVLYWAGCVIAALLICVGLYAAKYDAATLWFALAIAGVVWLVGRACRYVFAGY